MPSSSSPPPPDDEYSEPPQADEETVGRHVADPATATSLAATLERLRDPSFLDRVADPEKPSGGPLPTTRLRANLAASGVKVKPEDIERLVADQQKETSAMVVTRAWYGYQATRRDTRMLVLCGPSGVGKTVAAGYVLARETGLAVDCDDLVRELGGTRLGPRAHELLNTARCVLLDDLGVNEREGFAGAFYKLIKLRDANARSLTIITTNSNRNDIEGRYEPRAVDRIVGSGRFIELTGQSMRRT